MVSRQVGLTVVTVFACVALSGTFGSGATNNEQSRSFSNIGGTPFSLTRAVLVTPNPGSFASFGLYSIVHAPEPAAMALFGTGLVALAAIARRRLRKRAS